METIHSCISCPSYYFHGSLLKERKFQRYVHPLKHYCTYEKPARKLDGRRRKTDIDPKCERRTAPTVFTVFRPKAKPTEKTDNASRYLKVYEGQIKETVRYHLVSDGSYTVPTVGEENHALFDLEGNPVHLLRNGDVIERRTGFTLEYWTFEGKNVTGLYAAFDTKGIRWRPGSKPKEAPDA